MKRIAGGVAVVALLLAGCSSENGGGPASIALSPAAGADADECGRLITAWAGYANSAPVLTLNGEDLTAVDWETIYSSGQALLTAQKADVDSLTDPAAKTPWSSWQQLGTAAFAGLEGGDSRAVARANVAGWSEAGRTGVTACSTIVGAAAPALPTLSSAAPSVG